jgi:hypothetical protein
MRLTETHKLLFAFFTGCVFTYVVMTFMKRATPVAKEAFQAADSSAQLPRCADCGTAWPCPDHTTGGTGAGATGGMPVCPPMPDMSKYVLKSSIPPCPTCPDMANYMAKTECPPVPDMSQYVLKSSIPKQGPIIIDTSADNKKRCGDCPPCPRPRCPEVMCPPAPKCPACAPCPRAKCPQTQVKCRAEEVDSHPVRPFLSPLGVPGFG